MRRLTFFASIVFFIIIMGVIYTGSWKNVSLAKGNSNDLFMDNEQVDIERINPNSILDIIKPKEKVKVESILVKNDIITGSASEDEKVHKRNRNNKALFIGDSRTVGIAEYSGIKNAHFYANVGLSVYNIFKDKANVKGVGNVTLTNLLSAKEYGRIYLMIGINELGYDFNKTTQRYSELVRFIQDKQPNAAIILQGNLHVTKQRAKGDKIINNKMINRYNNAIASFADMNTIFYIDVNPIFDDNEGNLKKEMTSDGVHILAKYYKRWGEWIESETKHI